MSQADTTILVVSVFFGVVLGTLLARTSEQRQPIHGGLVARFFNWLGCVVFVAILPSVITGLIVHKPFLQVVLTAFALSFTSFLCLLPFSVAEYQPREDAKAKKQEQAWTAEDAKTSGL